MLTALSSALVLAGCGGGGGGGSPIASGGNVAPIGTGSSASGAITGFGSIIVGGVRYDDSKASVTDDDGEGKSSGDLKMGMVVKIKGGKKSSDGLRAEANSIEIYSELLGPIDSVTNSPTVRSLVILGQTVEILATTYFDDGLKFDTLVVGNVVEVYGFINPVTSIMTATRVELKVAPKVFKLQGSIRLLNTAAKTFQIGQLVIAYTNADLPGNLSLANGSVVRVRLATTPVTGTRNALKIRAAEYKHGDSNEAEIEGFITEFTSLALFKVNGLVVTTSAATKFEYPVSTMLKVGDRVEVEGSIVNGVLIAKKVELENRENYAEDMYKFELHGLISGLDNTARTFVVRGVSVSYTIAASGGGVATLFKKGVTSANIANGNKVEVKGTLRNGNVLMATEISLES